MHLDPFVKEPRSRFDITEVESGPVRVRGRGSYRQGERERDDEMKSSWLLHNRHPMRCIKSCKNPLVSPCLYTELVPVRGAGNDVG